MVGDAGDDVGHLQSILAKIGNFCLCSIGVFLVAEILVMYAGFRYSYRDSIDNLLVLLIGGIPICNAYCNVCHTCDWCETIG